MCRYVQRNMVCPTDAMSLKECLKEPFWPTITNNAYFGAVSFVCTECGED
jgi:hypothetical protein